MKNISTKTILTLIFFQLCFKGNAQGYGWVAMPDSNFFNGGLFFSVNHLTIDNQNNIYTATANGVFGESVSKYSNNAWRGTSMTGADETRLSPFQKDSMGRCYSMLTKGVVNSGYTFRFYGDTISLLDNSTSPLNFNTLNHFTVTKNGKVYVAKNGKDFYNQTLTGVWHWNDATNQWNNLKGTGNDTINMSSYIYQINNDKYGNIIAGVTNFTTSKYLRWNGTKWLEIGVNSVYLNSVSGIQNFVKDYIGDLYGYGVISSTNKQAFRAIWNETTNTWNQLTYNSNNPYSDTCIDINSITYDKLGNYYGISKCANANSQQFVAKWNGTQWIELGNLNANNQVLAITVDTAGTIYAGGSFTNANNEVYVAKYVIITPVKLTNYNLQLKENNSVVNQWTTATEVNTSHFNIQKSINGKTFETIGKVAAKGTSTYNYTDALATNNLLLSIYYRLQIIDKDGSKTYSEIKNIKLETSNGINIFPNPANNFINIECAGAKELFIIDYLGKVVKQITAPTTHEIISTKQLNKGLYIVKVIRANGTMAIAKFIKQ